MIEPTPEEMIAAYLAESAHMPKVFARLGITGVQWYKLVRRYGLKDRLLALRAKDLHVSPLKS